MFIFFSKIIHINPGVYPASYSVCTAVLNRCRTAG